jgi:hypothetical protein
VKVLTNGELWAFERRIDEIDRLCDECDADRDADVLDALGAELDAIVETIELSYKAARIGESGLKLVRSA